MPDRRHPPAPSYQIEIANEQTRLAVDVELLRRVTESTLRDEHVAAASVSVAVVDNAAIHRLNREHLAHDYPTDVLSFLLDSRRIAPPRGLVEDGVPLRAEGLELDGEVIVSAEMARDRAGEFGWPPTAELVFYLIHGLLHLAGYDDGCDDEKRIMRSRERRHLKTWKLTGDGQDSAADEPPPSETSTGPGLGGRR